MKTCERFYAGLRSDSHRASSARRNFACFNPALFFQKPPPTGRLVSGAELVRESKNNFGFELSEMCPLPSSVSMIRF